MMNYKICLPEKEDWCVPAALQTILKRRKIDLSQEEIAKNFPEFFEESVFKGFGFDEELLHGFFKQNNLELRCRFLNPFRHFEINDGTDLFLKETEKSAKDILVAYDSKFQQEKTDMEKIGHLAVILYYNWQSDLVRVTGIKKNPYSDVELNKLIRSMHPDKDKNYGFYVIS